MVHPHARRITGCAAHAAARIQHVVRRNLGWAYAPLYPGLILLVAQFNVVYRWADWYSSATGLARPLPHPLASHLLPTETEGGSWFELSRS